MTIIKAEYSNIAQNTLCKVNIYVVYLVCNKYVTNYINTRDEWICKSYETTLLTEMATQGEVELLRM